MDEIFVFLDIDLVEPLQFFSAQLGQLPEKIPLFFTDVGRRLDKDLDEQVSGSSALQVPHPLSPQAKDFPGLRPRRYLQAFVSVEGRDFCDDAQGGLGEGNQDLAG